jgi:hypothetical protein
MRRILFNAFFILLSFSLFAQTDNLIEYTIQVKENNSGYAVIVGGNDFISADYYKTRIDIGVKETVDEAVNRLNKLHFNVKSTTSVNGKQIVTMSAKIDPRIMESTLNEFLRMGETLDSIYNQKIKIDYRN